MTAESACSRWFWLSLVALAGCGGRPVGSDGIDLSTVKTGIYSTSLLEFSTDCTCGSREHRILVPPRDFIAVETGRVNTPFPTPCMSAPNELCGLGEARWVHPGTVEGSRAAILEAASALPLLSTEDVAPDALGYFSRQPPCSGRPDQPNANQDAGYRPLS